MMMMPNSNPMHHDDIDHQRNKSHIAQPDSGDDNYRDKSVENIEQPVRLFDHCSNNNNNSSSSSSNVGESSSTLPTAVKSSSSSHRDECSTEEEDDDDDDDFQWFSSSIAASGLTPQQPEQRDRERSLLDSLATYFIHSNSNDKKPDGCSSIDMFNAGGDVPSSSAGSRASISILIDDASAKSLSSKMRIEQQQEIGAFVDVDSNKFVRFGT